jgi:hypothetical protein
MTLGYDFRTAVSVLERLLERFDQLRGQPKQSTAT